MLSPQEWTVALTLWYEGSPLSAWPVLWVVENAVAMLRCRAMLPGYLLLKGVSPNAIPAFLYYAFLNDPRFNVAIAAMWRETHAPDAADPAGGRRGRACFSLLKVNQLGTIRFLDRSSLQHIPIMIRLNSLLLAAFAIVTLLPASAQVAALASKVIVTGASGRTGRLVFSQLSTNPKFEAVGCVRSESSAKRLMKEVPNCRLEQLAIVDVTNMDPASEQPKLLEGADAMIICTSAVPKISKSSVIRQMLKIPLNVIRKRPAINFRGFRFRYQPGQHPEKVDYEGQKKQIDLAKKLGVKRVVVVR